MLLVGAKNFLLIIYFEFYFMHRDFVKLSHTLDINSIMSNKDIKIIKNIEGLQFVHGK